MKKIVLAALLASSLLAGNDENYFGISTGEVQLEGEASGENFKSDKDTHYTFTLGHYYGDTQRASFSYTYVDAEGSVDTSDAFSLAYDFILPIAKDTFSVYAGPVVGYTRYEESIDGENLDLNDFHYGGQAGAIVRLMNNIEVEAGYRYLVETGSDTVLGVDVEADNMDMWYVGANLRF